MIIVKSEKGRELVMHCTAPFKDALEMILMIAISHLQGTKENITFRHETSTKIKQMKKEMMRRNPSLDMDEQKREDYN